MTFYIALSYKCNHKCMNCVLSQSDRCHLDIPVEDCIKKLDYYSNANNKQHDDVIVSGGEPFLNPDCFSLLKYLLKNKYSVTVLTNAVLLTDSTITKKIDELLRISTFNIVTAIHSNHKHIHDNIVGYAGSLRKKEKAVEYALSKGIGVTILVILSKYNYKELSSILSYYDSIFPELVNIVIEGMDYVGEANTHFNELGVSFEELQPYLQQTMDYIDFNITSRKKNSKHSRNISFTNIPLCAVDPYYWRFFRIRDETEIKYIAPNDKNIENDIITTSYTNKKNYKECLSCKVNNYCNGCWESAYLHFDNLLKPHT